MCCPEAVEIGLQLANGCILYAQAELAPAGVVAVTEILFGNVEPSNNRYSLIHYEELLMISEKVTRMPMTIKSVDLSSRFAQGIKEVVGSKHGSKCIDNK